MSRPSRSYAIIPAAGRSERMGRSKLLLSWRGRRREFHVARPRFKGLDYVPRSSNVIIIRTDADPAVKRFADSHDVDVVAADNPADMKASCLLGLKHLSEHYSPTPDDRFFMCPADIPGITTGLIDHLIAEAERNDARREPEQRSRDLAQLSGRGEVIRCCFPGRWPVK